MKKAVQKPGTSEAFKANAKCRRQMIKKDQVFKAATVAMRNWRKWLEDDSQPFPSPEVMESMTKLGAAFRVK